MNPGPSTIEKKQNSFLDDQTESQISKKTIENDTLMDDVWDHNIDTDHVVLTNPNLVMSTGTMSTDNNNPQNKTDEWDAAWNDVLNIHEAPRKKENLNLKDEKKIIPKKTNQKVQLPSKTSVQQTQPNNKTKKKTKPIINLQKHDNLYEDAYEGYDDCEDYY